MKSITEIIGLTAATIAKYCQPIEIKKRVRTKLGIGSTKDPDYMKKYSEIPGNRERNNQRTREWRERNKEKVRAYKLTKNELARKLHSHKRPE